MRFVRLTRPSERRFHREEAGTLRATEPAIEPRTGSSAPCARSAASPLGAPLSTEEQEEQRLTKVKALAVFSSDALSSSAYATDEILIVLAAAGAARWHTQFRWRCVIAGLLAVVAFSYRQTIKAYPSGGGAYIVARENLGDGAGLTAAAALAVDYVLTVAVSIAAGVLAITSAFPEVASLKVEIALACVLFITLANLRGLKESGTIFAIPTYGFIVSFVVLIGVGLVRVLVDPGLQRRAAGQRARARRVGADDLSASARLRLGLYRPDRHRGDLQRHPGLQEAGVEERVDDADVDGRHPDHAVLGITLLAHQLASCRQTTFRSRRRSA